MKYLKISEFTFPFEIQICPVTGKHYVYHPLKLGESPFAYISSIPENVRKFQTALNEMFSLYCTLYMGSSNEIVTSVFVDAPQTNEDYLSFASDPSDTKFMDFDTPYKPPKPISLLSSPSPSPSSRRKPTEMFHITFLVSKRIPHENSSSSFNVYNAVHNVSVFDSSGPAAENSLSSVRFTVATKVYVVAEFDLTVGDQSRGRFEITKQKTTEKELFDLNLKSEFLSLIQPIGETLEENENKLRRDMEQIHFEHLLYFAKKVTKDSPQANKQELHPLFKLLSNKNQSDIS
jgi:F-actin capping protein, beta subunit